MSAQSLSLRMPGATLERLVRPSLQSSVFCVCVCLCATLACKRACRDSTCRQACPGRYPDAFPNEARRFDFGFATRLLNATFMCLESIAPSLSLPSSLSLYLYLFLPFSVCLALTDVHGCQIMQNLRTATVVNMQIRASSMCVPCRLGSHLRARTQVVLVKVVS